MLSQPITSTHQSHTADKFDSEKGFFHSLTVDMAFHSLIEIYYLHKRSVFRESDFSLDPRV